MRRTLQTAKVFILLFLLWVAVAHAQEGPTSSRIEALWGQYKTAFIQQDGRVIDWQQKGISHSESQGYGLLLAVLCDDRKMFDTVWRWTDNNLQARKDYLLPWAWGKRHNGQWGIIDYNNATDGDVLVAFALIRAAARWDVPDYRRQGLKLVGAIRSHLATTYLGRTYLLPSYYGFQRDGELVLNPSYQVFAAYRQFAQVDDSEFWNRICRDSLFLSGAAAFGKMKLPADWVVLNRKGIAPWKERAPLFGYEAIRVILYLSWEKKPVFPEGLKGLFALYRQKGHLPATVDLVKDKTSPEEASAGFYAVCARAAARMGDMNLSRQLWTRALEKAATEKEQYYSTSLLLLAMHDVET